MAELRVTVKVGVDADSLKKAGGKIGDFLGKGLKVGGAAAGAALAAVGVAATVAAADTLHFAEQSDVAMEQFRRTTGLSEEGVEAFRESATNLFAGGVGEGIDDIAEAMATVNNVMQTGAKETEDLTKKALGMRDVFDKDVGESIDGVKVLMDEFGLSSDGAFDFMTKGIQKGLDRNGDFLDSIREYGNLFSDAGFSADQFFSVMETGAAGGVLGTDKIADAVKEFGIIMNEAGDDTKQAFSDIGLDFDAIAEEVAAGNMTWADSFDDVVKGINSIDEPVKRAQVQTAIFGTMAEDLGVSFTEGLSTASTSMQDMAGAMDNVIDKNMTIGESMENLHRQMVVALEPIAREFMPLLADGVAKVSEFLMAARPIFTGFASDLSGTLGPAITIIGDALQRIAAVFGIVGEEASGMDAVLAILKGTLDLVVTAVEAVAVAASLLADALEWVKEVGQGVGDILDEAAEGLDILKENPVKAIGNALGIGGGGSGGGFGEMLGFATGGVIPGAPGQMVPIMAHAGEVVANPNQGQAIVIGGEQFAVHQASRLAAAINAQRQRDLQGLVDKLSEMMN